MTATVIQLKPRQVEPLQPLRCENPILIGGCASAGTTLLAHLLNSHPAIYCGPEWNLFVLADLIRQFHTLSRAERQTLIRDRKTRHIGRIEPLIQSQSTRSKRVVTDAFLKGYRVEQYLENAGITHAVLTELAEQSHTLAQFADGFFSLLMQPQPHNTHSTAPKTPAKIRWAEKSPANCYSIGEFLALYPQGRYLHIIRDGRDNVESLARKPGYTLQQAAYRWIYNNALVLPYRNHPRCMVVRYEDLVTAPNTQLAAILAFLEEDPALAPDMLTAAQQDELDTTRKADMHSHITWHAQPHQPISAQNVGKWQRMPQAQQTEMARHFAYSWLNESVLGLLGLTQPTNGNSLLTAFGYPTGTPWHTQPTPTLGFKVDSWLERWSKHCNPYYTVRW